MRRLLKTILEWADGLGRRDSVERTTWNLLSRVIRLLQRISRKCLRYQVQQLKNGVFEEATIFCKDVIHPVLVSSCVAISSASDLLTKMEKLWETSESLNNCRYLPDIDITTPKQRLKAGLLPTCMVWPNAGDQLAPLPKTAGLYLPFAYVAGCCDL